MQQGDRFHYAGPAVRTLDGVEQEVQVDGDFVVDSVDAGGHAASVSDARLQQPGAQLDRAHNAYRLLAADVDAYSSTPREAGT